MDAQQHPVLLSIDHGHPVAQIRGLLFPDGVGAFAVNGAVLLPGHNCFLAAKAQQIIDPQAKLQIDLTLLHAAG